MKDLALAAVLILLATAANAHMCIKCDQTTSYRCYMSIYGTKMNCDSPSDAGCFTWGACSNGSECEYGCVLEPDGATVLHLASVSITTPLPERAKSRTPRRLNA